jgi:hypothetical protein
MMRIIFTKVNDIMLKKHDSGTTKYFKKTPFILKDYFCFNCPEMRKTMT